MSEMVDQSGTKTDFDALDGVENQQAQFTVKTVQRYYILKAAVRLENMIDLVLLHWPPVTGKPVITDIL